MLNLTYATEAEIPEAAKQFYTQKDGAWNLNVTGGAVPAARLAEFRDQNTTLKGQFESLLADITGEDASSLKGIAFDAAKAKVVSAVQKYKDDAQKAGKGDLDRILGERTEAMKTAHATELQKLTAERDAAQNRLSALQINQEVLKFATEAGIRSTATQDLLSRAAASLKLEDGKIVAYDEHGKPRYDVNSNPLSVKDWVGDLSKAAPHLFEASQGPGGKGPGGGKFQGQNPFVKGEHYNMTAQAALINSDPETAKALAAAAGINLQI